MFDRWSCQQWTEFEVDRPRMNEWMMSCLRCRRSSFDDDRWCKTRHRTDDVSHESLLTYFDRIDTEPERERERESIGYLRKTKVITYVNSLSLTLPHCLTFGWVISSATRDFSLDRMMDQPGVRYSSRSPTFSSLLHRDERRSCWRSVTTFCSLRFSLIKIFRCSRTERIVQIHGFQTPGSTDRFDWWTNVGQRERRDQPIVSLGRRFSLLDFLFPTRQNRLFGISGRESDRSYQERTIQFIFHAQ